MNATLTAAPATRPALIPNPPTSGYTPNPPGSSHTPATSPTPNPPASAEGSRASERGPQRSGEVGYPNLPFRGDPAKQGREVSPAIAARNATTHGLFARDVVLPHLGEDPAAFDELLQQLLTQLPPRHLLERHYLEQIAAASWRLRRLHRWQAQIYEDDTLSEDQRLDKLDKVLRHETALTRQINRAIRMMNRDLAWLFQSRLRDDALYQRNVTDAECRQDPDLAIDVQQHIWREARAASPDAALDYARLDNTHPSPVDDKICQNEPPPHSDTPSPTPLPSGEGWPRSEAGVGPSSEIPDHERDVSYVHPDGRPVFLNSDTWRAIQRIHDQGDHQRADQFLADYRRHFLEGQQTRRDHPEWFQFSRKQP